VRDKVGSFMEREDMQRYRAQLDPGLCGRRSILAGENSRRASRWRQQR